MTLAATTMTFKKLRPGVINHRDYKHFNNENYRKDLLVEMLNSCLRFDDGGCSEVFRFMSSNFRSACSAKAESCAGNRIPFINKTLSKKIMKRTRLRNKFLKDRMDKNKQKIFVTFVFPFLRKTKKEYYENLDEN